MEKEVDIKLIEIACDWAKMDDGRNYSNALDGYLKRFDKAYKALVETVTSVE